MRVMHTGTARKHENHVYSRTNRRCTYSIYTPQHCFSVWLPANAHRHNDDTPANTTHKLHTYSAIAAVNWMHIVPVHESMHVYTLCLLCSMLYGASVPNEWCARGEPRVLPPERRAACDVFTRRRRRRQRKCIGRASQPAGRRLGVSS